MEVSVLMLAMQNRGKRLLALSIPKLSSGNRVVKDIKDIKQVNNVRISIFQLGWLVALKSGYIQTVTCCQREDPFPTAGSCFPIKSNGLGRITFKLRASNFQLKSNNFLRHANLITSNLCYAKPGRK